MLSPPCEMQSNQGLKGYKVERWRYIHKNNNYMILEGIDGNINGLNSLIGILNNLYDFIPTPPILYERYDNQERRRHG